MRIGEAVRPHVLLVCCLTQQTIPSTLHRNTQNLTVRNLYFVDYFSLHKVARSLRNRICWDAAEQLTQLPGTLLLRAQYFPTIPCLLPLCSGIGERVSSQLIHKRIGSLDDLAGAKQETLAECCHKTLKLDHLIVRGSTTIQLFLFIIAFLQSLQRMCAALPRYIVNLQQKGDLVKISLLSFDLKYVFSFRFSLSALNCFPLITAKGA